MKNIKNKGFTFIELLAVIAILGLVITIVGVAISNVAIDADKSAKKLVMDTIIDGVKNYITEFPPKEWYPDDEVYGYEYTYITVGDLIDAGIFSSTMLKKDIYKKMGITRDTKIKITRDENHKIIKVEIVTEIKIPDSGDNTEEGKTVVIKNVISMAKYNDVMYKMTYINANKELYYAYKKISDNVIQVSLVTSGQNSVISYITGENKLYIYKTQTNENTLVADNVVSSSLAVYNDILYKLAYVNKDGTITYNGNKLTGIRKVIDISFVTDGVNSILGYLNTNHEFRMYNTKTGKISLVSREAKSIYLSKYDDIFYKIAYVNLTGNIIYDGKKIEGITNAKRLAFITNNNDTSVGYTTESGELHLYNIRNKNNQIISSNILNVEES